MDSKFMHNMPKVINKMNDPISYFEYNFIYI